MSQTPAAYPRIILKKDREVSIKRFHPWIFSGAIKGVSRQVDEGEVVEVFSHDGTYLATGYFEAASIAVKIFSFERIPADTVFWQKKLFKAYHLRQALGLTTHPHLNAYRLAFTEGDGLPGLIIDFYNGVAVFQVQSKGMFNARNEIAQAMKVIYGESLKAIYDKSSPTFFSDTDNQRILFGTQPGNVIISENGHKFNVDIEKGQKTGFFLDQRDNRKLLSTFAANRKTLNLFSYTGAFSVYAIAAGATEAYSVDSSAAAIANCDENMRLNGIDLSKHHGVVADVKDYIASMDADFGLIVLDPPAFAKHHESRHKAMLGYRYLNETVINKMPSGSILFTFSCSQVVGQDLFQSTVMAAAIAAGRSIRILHKLTQPPDHPVSIFHPEGEYLKGLVLYIE